MNHIQIRPIEHTDKANYLRLFNYEDFGCIGVNSDLKPSIYEEERIVDGVLDGSIISTSILIIEDNCEFIGYTTVSRPSRHSYHIGEFVTLNRIDNNTCIRSVKQNFNTFILSRS